ncbi:MAG: hypothetical protein MK193_08605 [Lentisphaeria bacterium]|nr:hypothetical protein [Lentisphaeria bacterium]
MNQREIYEIYESLPKGRSKYIYYKDKNAVVLLQELLRKSNKKNINEIKRGPFGRLLNLPLIHDYIRSCGNGEILLDDLRYLCCKVDQLQHFRLELSSWGSSKCWEWDQTTRRDSNLVLLINFGGKHMDAYHRLLKPENDVFTSSGHPHSKRQDTTMSWVRMDVDMKYGQVLIEEVQNDWLRDSLDLYRDLKSQKSKSIRERWLRNYGIHSSVDDTCQYIEQEVLPLVKMWDVISLTAAVEFCFNELGIYDLFYHTWEAGSLYKFIDCSAPPQYIYKKLPRTLCFQKTKEKPIMLEGKKHKVKRKLKRDLALIKQNFYRLVI